MKDLEAQKLKEESLSKDIKGRLVVMQNELYDNSTPFEYTCSGIELGSFRTKSLASYICYNNTLLSIHMSRKQISDIDGELIAKMLEKNKVLRKLELEGNLLGVRSASEFGKQLKINKTLKYLDLESNQLTMEGQDPKGIYALVEFLDHNKSLLVLNLANNMLDAACGEMFKQKLETNHTLIDFDYSMNKPFNLEDSRQIQDYLRRNKAEYDAERLKEWKERKFMKAEDEVLRELYLQEQS